MDTVKKVLTIALQLIALTAVVLTGIWIFAKLFNSSNNPIWQFIQMVIVNPKKKEDDQSAEDLKTALDSILHPDKR